MTSAKYQSPASIQAWQRASARYHNIIRFFRLVYIVPLSIFQLPLVGLDTVLGTTYYGRSRWSFVFRALRLIGSYYIWATNPGTLPPKDVLSWSARCNIGALKKGQSAELVIAPGRDGLCMGDARLDEKGIKPADVPCFWMWLPAKMDSPTTGTKTIADRKVVMYFVGGGMVQGHPIESPLGWKVMASTGAVTFGVNFRKCVEPATAFPAALQDAVSAFYYLLDQGFQPENISIMGDSGGGGIVVTTILYLIRQKLKLPGSVILISPWVDLASHWTEDKERLNLDILNPEMLSMASYQYVVNRPELRGTLLSPSLNKLPDGYTFIGFPKTLLNYGDAEMFAHSNARLGVTLKEAGCDIDVIVGKDEIHVYPYFSEDKSPESFFGAAKKLINGDQGKRSPSSKL